MSHFEARCGHDNSMACRCAHYMKTLVGYMLGIGLMAAGGMILVIAGCESMCGWATGFYYRFRLEAALLVLAHRNDSPTRENDHQSPSSLRSRSPSPDEVSESESESELESEDSDSDGQIRINPEGLIRWTESAHPDLNQRRLSQDSRNSE